MYLLCARLVSASQPCQAVYTSSPQNRDLPRPCCSCATLARTASRTCLLLCARVCQQHDTVLQASAGLNLPGTPGSCRRCLLVRWPVPPAWPPRTPYSCRAHRGCTRGCSAASHAAAAVRMRPTCSACAGAAPAGLQSAAVCLHCCRQSMESKCRLAAAAPQLCARCRLAHRAARFPSAACSQWLSCCAPAAASARLHLLVKVCQLHLEHTAACATLCRQAASSRPVLRPNAAAVPA